MNERTLRDDLQSTYDDLSREPEPTPQAGAEPGDNGAQGAAGAEAEPAAAAQAEPVEPKLDATGRAHAPDGKFAKKPGDPDPQPEPKAEGAIAQPQPEPDPKPAAPEPQSEAIRIPPSLPAAIKAKFGSLDPDVQSAFVALEETVQTAKAEWGAKGERLNRFDQLVRPRLARWQMNGLDEYSGIQTLLAAQDVLDANPLQGLVHIARSYGVTPAHLAQAFGLQPGQTTGQQPGQDGQVAATLPPGFEAALAPLVNGLQTLQREFNSSKQDREQAELQSLNDQIAAFAAKPENLYFTNVLDEVMARVQMARASGQPATIETVEKAYQAAIWADPTIRELLKKSEVDASAAEATRKAAEEKKKAEDAARAKARDAQQAAGSVTGSPAAGSASPKPAFGSVREAAVAAMQELGGM